MGKVLMNEVIYTAITASRSQGLMRRDSVKSERDSAGHQP